MPGQNARTADYLLNKINDAELKLCETLHKKLSWHSGTDFLLCKAPFTRHKKNVQTYYVVFHTILILYNLF